MEFRKQKPSLRRRPSGTSRLWLTIRRLFAATFACGLPGTAAADPLTVKIGFASVGADNRQFSGGSSAAVAHAEHYLDEELRDHPEVRIEWSFFKGAGPAVNEAFANNQLDFAIQGDLPEIIGRADGLKTKILLASGAHAPTYLAVPLGSDVRKVADLRRRKVSIFRAALVRRDEEIETAASHVRNLGGAPRAIVEFRSGGAAVDVFELALAPSFLRAICSIRSFGIAKFSVNVCSPDINKNANKTDGCSEYTGPLMFCCRERLRVFSIRRENFPKKSRNRTKDINRCYC
jgi:hypothetical protein